MKWSRSTWMALMLVALVPLRGAAQASDLACSTKDAAQASALERARAERVSRAIALRKQKRYADAYELLAAAVAPERDACVAAQLAIVLRELAKPDEAEPSSASEEDRLRRRREAYDLLREALATRDNPWVEKRRRVLEAWLHEDDAALEIRIGPEGASVSVDGTDVGVTPLSAAIITSPGTHEVRASRSGYASQTVTVSARPGGPTPVQLDLKAEQLSVASAPQSTAPPSLPAPRERPGATDLTVKHARLRTLLLSSAGAGAAIAVASVIPWLRADQRLSHLRHDCATDAGRDGCSDASLRSEKRRIGRLDVATNIMLVTGTSVAAASLLTYFLYPSLRARHLPSRATASVSVGAAYVGAIARLGF